MIMRADDIKQILKENLSIRFMQAGDSIAVQIKFDGEVVAHTGYIRVPIQLPLY